MTAGAVGAGAAVAGAVVVARCDALDVLEPPPDAVIATTAIAATATARPL